jgi:hypothetical protein
LHAAQESPVSRGVREVGGRGLRRVLEEWPEGRLDLQRSDVVERRVEVDQAGRPLRVARRERGDLVAAERVPREHRALQPERVENRPELLDALGERVAVTLRLAGAPVAHAGDADDAVPVGEARRERVEHVRGVAEAW